MHVADIPESRITSDILNKGAVLIYFTFGGGIYPLPYTSDAGNHNNVMNFILRLGLINITRYTFDNTNSVPLPVFLQYRYILIPPALAVAGVGKQISEGQPVMLSNGTRIDYVHMTYADVCTRLGVKP